MVLVNLPMILSSRLKMLKARKKSNASCSRQLPSRRNNDGLIILGSRSRAKTSALTLTKPDLEISARFWTKQSALIGLSIRRKCN